MANKKTANKKLAIRSSKPNERTSRKIKKKSFSLLNEYKECWKYIQESRKFIYFVAGIFLFFLLMGFFVSAPEFLSNGIMKFIRGLLTDTQNMSQLNLISFIISNNVQSTFFGIIFGIFFGLFPLASAVANGYVLGFVSSISVNNSGLLSLFKILPHGIFELPAIFISLGLGLKTGMFVFRKDKMKAFMDYLSNSLRIFLLIIIPLLIIAGIIEGTLVFLLK